MKGYRKYILNKLVWFAVTFIFAFMLNFILPRLMPGDPVAAIVARLAQGMSNATGVQAIYEQYAELFGTNKPILVQFFIYVRNVAQGDFGFSFSQYPRTVADVLGSAVWWTVGLQLPAILVGWMLGNLLGALAAYVKGGYDKVLMPISLFAGSIPAFGMAVILLVIFAVQLKWFPTSGGYGFDMIPSFTLAISCVCVRSLSIAILVDRIDHHRRSGDRHALNGHL